VEVKDFTSTAGKVLVVSSSHALPHQNLIYFMVKIISLDNTKLTLKKERFTVFSMTYN